MAPADGYVDQDGSSGQLGRSVEQAADEQTIRLFWESQDDVRRQTSHSERGLGP